MTQNPEQFGAPSTPENDQTSSSQTAPPAPSAEDKHSGPMTDHENSLLHKLAEVGDDTVKRLKEIFSEVDREELRKSLNRENVQRTIASTLDTFNKKAQALLVPKDGDESAPEGKAEPDAATHSDSMGATSPDAPGPVGTEAVHPDETPRHSKEEPPESETRSFV